MSEHHAAPAESASQTNPVQLAVAVSIGALSLIVGLILVASFAVGSWGQRSVKDDPAMTPEAVARRIAPVSTVVVDPAAPAVPVAAPAAVAPAASVAPATKVAGKVSGEATYKAVCIACHSVGVAGAPKTGDKAAWAPRIGTGIDALYASALKGKAAMPAKGGNAALSDAEVKAAVDYLVAAAK
jgi:cytochrome c5